MTKMLGVIIHERNMKDFENRRRDAEQKKDSQQWTGERFPPVSFPLEKDPFSPQGRKGEREETRMWSGGSGSED
ncbi:hypothetical protein E2562_015635 [Oryza meyeriana var. granulata]|uniref:Uncharacterized protein n=1 Tax=Oryza meyeriana var. granulata TaxID=110450 RepID=A0A6G1EM11_9ORYZ|nr:hypothetical protein E2562_015635 [Oryza meyeriana var. granulata]